MTNETKIILADGCFDPFHEGHIHYLRAAKELGTKLIVNMATDREIWLKRPSIGPFLKECVRKQLLESLRFVDSVVVIDTAEALNEINPNIYAKGLDWKGKLPNEELEICSALGIDIIFLDTVSNSSTNILNDFINRIKSSD